MENVTKIYEYKNNVIIDATYPVAGAINDPMQPGQMGYLLSVNKETLNISQEAINLLLSIPKGNGGLGELECFQANDNDIVFGWLGGMKKVVSTDMEMSRDWNPGLLDSACIIKNDLPIEIKEQLDKFL